MNFKLTAALLASIVAASPAAAATFTETLNLPAYRSGQPYVLQATGDFTSGLKLTAADAVSNPDGWNNVLNVTLDTVAKTISFTGDGENTYQTIDFSITDIMGQSITGLFAVNPYGAVVNAGFDYGFTASFTSSSINIGWAVNNVAAGDTFAITGAGTSVFSYTTLATGAVPEPATWAMMIGGVGMVGGAMRRRKVSTKVSFA
jgi:hypothetical protein